MTETTKTVLVHKKDEEGALILDAMTGNIVSPVDERPDWANGLATALIAERHGYYNSRLGPNYTPEMKEPQAIAFEDLGWIGADEAGEIMEMEADAEHRMETIATVLNVDRFVDAATSEHKTMAAEVEVALDRHRSPEEMAAFEHSQEAGFQRATGTDRK